MVQVCVGEAVERGTGSTHVRQAAVARATLAHRIRQGDQVILVGIGG